LGILQVIKRGGGKGCFLWSGVLERFYDRKELGGEKKKMTAKDLSWMGGVCLEKG